MGLVVLRRFSDLNQAQAAAAALRGAGLHPAVLEEATGAVLPFHQLYLGGCRVGVPAHEAELGAEILRAAAGPAEATVFDDEAEGYEASPPRRAGPDGGRCSAAS